MLSFFFSFHCLHCLWTVSDDSMVNPEGEGKEHIERSGKEGSYDTRQAWSPGLVEASSRFLTSWEGLSVSPAELPYLRALLLHPLMLDSSPPHWLLETPTIFTAEQS